MKPVFEEEGVALDTYLQKEPSYKRLIDDYQNYGELIVAFDYDDTLAPTKTSRATDQVLEIARVCSKIPSIKILVYTCRGALSDGEEIRTFCSDHGVRVDAINTPLLDLGGQNQGDQKLFYNIFFDDRAGLRAAYEDMVGFLKWYYNERG